MKKMELKHFSSVFITAIINSPIFKREIETTETNIQPPMYGILERRRYDSVGSSTSNSAEESHSQTLSRRGSIKKKKFLQLIDGLRQSENLMKESNVLANDDGISWDWDIITTIFTKVSESNANFNSNAKHNVIIIISIDICRQIQAINWT